MTRLSLRLLGVPMIRFSDGAVSLLERHDAALLAVLAIDGPQSRRALGAMLWPGADLKRGRENLRQRLHRFKGDTGVALAPDKSEVVALNEAIETDVHMFEATVQRDRSFGIGQLLGEIDYSDIETLDDWVSRARHTVAARKLDMVARLADAAEARSDFRTALDYALRVVREAPSDEGAHRRLMRLHYLAGDRAAALKSYAACRTTLQVDLGVAPDAETERLAAAIHSASTRPAITGGVPIHIRRPPCLVGRELEWKTVIEARRDRVAVVVRGEGGIGKTRLIEELVQSLPDSALVRCLAGDTCGAYASLARVLDALVTRYGLPNEPWVAAEVHRLLPGQLDVPADPLEPERLNRAVVEVLAACSTRGLRMVCVDDLHHCDIASADILLPLASAGVGGLAWIFTTRLPNSNDLDARLVAADPRRVVTIDLSPLSATETKELVTSLALPSHNDASWAAALHRHVGGNPFFILQTLLELCDGARQPVSVDLNAIPTPRQVRALVDERVRRLTAGAIALAQVAAVAGTDFDAPLATAVLSNHLMDLPAPWAELEHAGVLDGNRFVHDLVAESVLEAIPVIVRSALHQRVAEVLLYRGAPLARTAQHFFAAESWPSAGDAFTQAARKAATREGRGQEFHLWRRAVDSYYRAGQAERAFDAECESIVAMTATHRIEQVRAVTARLLAQASGDSQRISALLAHTQVVLLAGSFSEGLALAKEAASICCKVEDRPGGYRALRLEALALSQLGQAKVAASLLLSAVDTYRDYVELLRGSASDVGYVLMHAGRCEEAVRWYERAIDWAGASGDRSEELVCTSNLATITDYLGLTEKAVVHTEQSLKILARTGDMQGVGAGCAWVSAGAVYTAAGRFEEALTAFENARLLLEGDGAEAMRTILASHHANTLLQLGRPDLARKKLASAPENLSLPAAAQLRRAIAEARIAAATGRDPGQRLSKAIASGGPITAQVQVLAELDQARLDEPARGLEACERLENIARDMGLAAATLRSQIVRVECLQRVGDHGQAASTARQVFDRLSDRSPIDFYRPEALLILASALTAGAADDALRERMVAAATGWITEAERRVPPPLRQSFRNGNPSNRRIFEGRRRLL